VPIDIVIEVHQPVFQHDHGDVYNQDRIRVREIDLLWSASRSPWTSAHWRHITRRTLDRRLRRLMRSPFRLQSGRCLPMNRSSWQSGSVFDDLMKPAAKVARQHRAGERATQAGCSSPATPDSADGPGGLAHGEDCDHERGAKGQNASSFRLPAAIRSCGRVKAAEFNRRMRKTARPVVWEGDRASILVARPDQSNQHVKPWFLESPVAAATSSGCATSDRDLRQLPT
jgi:hypothetical protein